MRIVYPSTIVKVSSATLYSGHESLSTAVRQSYALYHWRGSTGAYAVLLTTHTGDACREAHRKEGGHTMAMCIKAAQAAFDYIVKGLLGGEGPLHEWMSRINQAGMCITCISSLQHNAPSHLSSLTRVLLPTFLFLSHLPGTLGFPVPPPGKEALYDLCAVLKTIPILIPTDDSGLAPDTRRRLSAKSSERIHKFAKADLLYLLLTAKARIALGPLGSNEEREEMLKDYLDFEEQNAEILNVKGRLANAAIDIKITCGHLLIALNRREEAVAMARAQIPFIESSTCQADGRKLSFYMKQVIGCFTNHFIIGKFVAR